MLRRPATVDQLGCSPRSGQSSRSGSNEGVSLSAFVVAVSLDVSSSSSLVDIGYKVYIMTKSTKSSKATAVKTPETGSKSASATSNSVPTTQDGVMQAAITDFIRNDETVMQAIIDTVSNALVKKNYSVTRASSTRCRLN